MNDDKILIIAEKPSLAKNIVAAITPTPRWKAYGGKSGYWENDEYIVSYAFGHLFRLKKPEEYDEDLKKWELSSLPITPSFAFVPKSDAIDQIKLLKSLVNRKDVGSVMHAGDSDREGEIIIRNILYECHNTKPVLRLWLPDQTPKTIVDGLDAFETDAKYDNLANEGYARTYIDWLYGMNISRLASIKSNEKLRVGRVTTPIINAVCERDRAIENFVATTYYIPVHNTDIRLVSSHKFDTKSEADVLTQKYNTLPLTVKNISKTSKVYPRPHLLALSDLQGLAGKKFKYTPLETLNITQQLYEKGYVTYPRTNAQYMAEAEKDKARQIIEAVQGISVKYEHNIQFIDSKKIFDDSKIEAHSALTPTTQIPKRGVLSDDEKNIYTIILKRFASVFCNTDYKVNRTTIELTNGEEDFSVTGETLITEGYTMFEPNEKKDTELPEMNVGDILQPQFETTEKKTEPPAHYTVETLNYYLKHPYSSVEKTAIKGEDAESAEVIDDVELGTEATRAGLIDAAIKSGYIVCVQNKYSITDLGKYYVDTLDKLGIDMARDTTLTLSKTLKAVYRNQKTVDDVVGEAIKDIETMCEEAKDKRVEKAKGEEKQKDGKLGVCPECGSPFCENSKTFKCSNKECGCVIFKDCKYFEAIGLKPTKTVIKSLLAKGYVDCDLTSKKTGKPYHARIHLEFTDKYATFDMSFPETKK